MATRKDDLAAAVKAAANEVTAIVASIAAAAPDATVKDQAAALVTLSHLAARLKRSKLKRRAIPSSTD
jgi:hypothetical protein